MPLQAGYRELAAEHTSAAKQELGEKLISTCYFGSAARGEASPESDLDVLVVADALPNDLAGRMRLACAIREKARKSEAGRSLRRAGRSTLISSIYLTPEEVRAHPPILLDVADHGVIWYDRDNFLTGVLTDIKHRLSELGARKVRAKKGYYWILKPDRKPGEVIEI